MNNIYDYLPEDPYKGLESYLERDRLFFFGREDEREEIIYQLGNHPLTIVYGASGVGKSSVLRAGVNHYFRQLAQENADEDIEGKPGLGVIIFPPIEGNLQDKISWQDPISGIKELLKVEMEILGIKETPSENLSLTDTLKAWIELIRDNTGGSCLYIILDQFEEYFLLLSEQNGKDKAPLHKFAQEFPKAVNDLELSVNFLIAIREDSLSKIDYFKREIPNWFENHVEIAPLNRDQAKEAIEKPIAEYNRQKIILNSLLSSRLTVLSGDRNTHKSTLLELGIARYLREKNQGCIWCKNEDWQTGLKQQIQTDLAPLVKQNSQLSDRLTPSTSDLSLVETFQKWRQIIGQESAKSPIYLILDQFESYFRQKVARDRDGVLIDELRKVINDDSLNVNILLSLRRDALPQLKKDCNDFLKYQFLYLYKEKGIDRITKDSFDPRSSKPLIEVEIESDLANEILNDFESEQTEIKIEAPYLQLVMTRLWQREKELINADKNILLKISDETYNHLGLDADLRLAKISWIIGWSIAPVRAELKFKAASWLARTLQENRLERILKEHLYEQINQLDEGDRKIAVRILYYLVTPSGTQLLSLSAHDLTGFANQNRLSDESEIKLELVKQLLEQLSHGSSRIIRPVEGDRYKIFFSILAKEVSNWVQLHHQIKYLKQEAEIASQQFKSSQLQALLTAMKAAQMLRRGIKEDKTLAGDASTPKVTETLQTILQEIKEKNVFKLPEGSVYSVNFSPDGQLLAMGGSDGTVQLWDLQKKKLDQLDQLDSPIYYVGFSPDGKKLAAAKGLGTICLWDLQNHQQIDPPLNKGKSPFYFLSFSGDGHKLAAGAEDGTPYLWDLQSQQLQQPAKGEQQDSPIYYVSLSANGQMLATSLGNYSLVLWKLEEDKKELRKVTGDYQGLSELQGVSSVAFVPKAPMKLATGSADGTVYLWNLENGNGEPTIFPNQKEPTPIAHIDFNSKGNQLATVSIKGRVCLWNLYDFYLLAIAKLLNDKYFRLWAFYFHKRLEDNQKPQKPQFTTETTNDILYRVSFSADSNQLAIVQWDGSARLWDLQPQKREEVIKKLPGEQVTQIIFNPNEQHEKQVAIGFMGGKVQIYDDINREEQTYFLKPHYHRGPVYRLRFSSDGKQLATASQDGTFQVYDLENKKIFFFKENIKKSPVYGICFSHDGKHLFTGSGDGMVRLWDLAQKKQIHEFRGHQGTIYYLSVSPDGKKLATASVDCTVRLWNVQDNLMNKRPSFEEFKGHQGPAFWVSFSPDGQQLATASGDGTVRLWNLEGKEREQARCIHQAPVFCVNFIPDTQELVTGCWDGKIRLWSLQGRLLAEFPIDKDAVLCVSPSFDGELLATVSDLWNGKAQLLERLEGEIDKRIEDLLNQGCEWLDDYFKAHPKVRQDFQNLKICPRYPVILGGRIANV